MAPRLNSVLVVLTIACVAATLPARSAEESDPNEAFTKQITALLEEQKEYWNAGDIDGFMRYYWKSDDLTFSSGGTTRRGWGSTLRRYREQYPTPEKMGKLAFSDLEVRPIGSAAALVLGRWALEREPDPVGGNFTLVLERHSGGWLIIHDHTSRLADE